MGQQAEAGQGVVGHEGATAHGCAEQPFLGTQAKGARDGGEVDVEEIRQLALGRQTGSRQQRAAFDVGLKLRGELERKRPRALQHGAPAHGVVVKRIDRHGRSSFEK